MGSQTLAIVYSLGSAVCWGAGDFSGGIATRKNHVFGVIVTSQAIGVIILVIAAVMMSEPVAASGDLLLSGAAGLAGAIGLAALYTGLARSRMGVVAPVTAITAAGLPVLAGFLLEGLPSPIKMAGFAFAAAAVWLLSRGNDGVPIHVRELGMPLLAGAGFGLFFILIDQVKAGSVLWPLVAARGASISLLTLLIWRQKSAHFPGSSGIIPVILAGVGDTAGNVLFILAVQLGRLDMAAMLSALYPAVTVILAWLVLKERLSGRQWTGVLVAILALFMIAF